MALEREKMVQVGFRFPQDVLERLDARIERDEERNPGRKPLTRADLVRQFVLEGLARSEGKPKRG